MASGRDARCQRYGPRQSICDLDGVTQHLAGPWASELKLIVESLAADALHHDDIRFRVGTDVMDGHNTRVVIQPGSM